MALVNLSLLGGFDCRSPSGQALALPTHKARVLLAYLAVNAGQRHARDKLADLLWGERGDAQARANLRKALSRLREALPRPAQGCLELDASGLTVRADGVDLDIARFVPAARGRRPLRARTPKGGIRMSTDPRPGVPAALKPRRRPTLHRHSDPLLSAARTSADHVTSGGEAR